MIKSLKDISKYNIPPHILEDVNKRITDWLASGGNIEDNYIKQQLDYLDKIVKTRNLVN